MLISHHHRFLFIHIQKTGGDTLSRLLADRVPDLEPVGAKHEQLRNEPSLLDQYSSYFKFAFVRNPWDRLVSWYSMLTEAAHLTEEDARRCERSKIRYEQARNNRLWRYALEESTDFSSFIRNCTLPIEVRPGVYYSFVYNQLDYLADCSGEVRVDFIGRFENFNEDLDTVLDGLKISHGNVGYHENASRHAHYSDFYTEQTRAIVQERFRSDINYFGYQFEPP